MFKLFSKTVTANRIRKYEEWSKITLPRFLLSVIDLYIFSINSQQLSGIRCSTTNKYGNATAWIGLKIWDTTEMEFHVVCSSVFFNPYKSGILVLKEVWIFVNIISSWTNVVKLLAKIIKKHQDRLGLLIESSLIKFIGITDDHSSSLSLSRTNYNDDMKYVYISGSSSKWSDL